VAVDVAVDVTVAVAAVSLDGSLAVAAALAVSAGSLFLQPVTVNIAARTNIDTTLVTFFIGIFSSVFSWRARDSLFAVRCSLFADR
jgi:hypothetical protein